MAKADLTAARLRELFSYDPVTGVFCRLVARCKRHLGPTGSINRHPRQGYVLIHVDGAQVLAHRLAWLYVNGEWPNGEVDHINGDKTDNRIANLRLASRTLNAHNLHGLVKHNRSGMAGVRRDAKSGRFHANISIFDRGMLLGSFATAEEAAAAYVGAKRVVFRIFGEEHPTDSSGMVPMEALRDPKRA